MADPRVSSRVFVVVHPFRHDGPEFLKRLGIEKQAPVGGLETADEGSYLWLSLARLRA